MLFKIGIMNGRLKLIIAQGGALNDLDSTGSADNVADDRRNNALKPWKMFICFTIDFNPVMNTK